MEIGVDDRHSTLDGWCRRDRCSRRAGTSRTSRTGCPAPASRAPSLSATFTILFCCVKLSVPKSMNVFAGSNAASIATQAYVGAQRLQRGAVVRRHPDPVAARVPEEGRRASRRCNAGRESAGASSSCSRSTTWRRRRPSDRCSCRSGTSGPCCRCRARRSRRPRRSNGASRSCRRPASPAAASAPASRCPRDRKSGAGSAVPVSTWASSVPLASAEMYLHVLGRRQRQHPRPGQPRGPPTARSRCRPTPASPYVVPDGSTARIS